jgi:hypothetical protein
VGVPEKCRQYGQPPPWVFTVAIPAQQGLDRKTVAKVMQAWAATGFAGTESNLPGQRVEGSVNLTFVEWVSVLVYEEVAVGPRPKPAIPTFPIIGKDLTG